MLPKITTADIQRELDRRRYNKFDLTFPDNGKYARELYVKHMEVIAQTAKQRQVCMMAANRCITPWTYLANNQLALSTVCDSSFDVQSWDGESQCTAKACQGYVKGILPAFRVILDNNQFFDCTDEHQVLTCEGYLSLRRLVSSSSGLRLKRTREDYLASCVADGYLCGQPLRLPLNIDPTQSPLQADAQEPGLFWLADEVEQIFQCNRSFQEHDHFSSKDDLHHFAGLFEHFRASFYETPFVRLSDELQAFLQSLLELSPAQLKELSSYNQSFLRGQLSFVETLELEPLNILFPHSHPCLIGGRTIKAIAPLGLQPIIDFHVPHYNNYLAGGVYHHNCGKSELGAYIVAAHLTGNYPHWWNGKRFTKPVNIQVAGETGKLVRDSVQKKLFGEIGQMGTGSIPKEFILTTNPKSGIPNAIDTGLIKHKSGGTSIVQFQSYDQGREAFQATERDVIWDDEEPPLEVYAEQLLRTMTTNGIVLSTFTPLKGVSDTVLHLQAQAEKGKAAVISATWDDAPHLTTEQKEELLATLPPHQREARSKGVPSLGSGAIYPVLEQEFVIDPIPIPAHWKHGYGFDVGWNNTAACWGAYDADSDVLYIYADYKEGQKEPAVHASAIKARGDWIKGAIDPASRGRGQGDGQQLIKLYKQQGLKLILADNTVEAGIFDFYERLTTGRLKVFSTCTKFLEEYRLYRRDEKGKIVKQNDHIMDAARYLVRTMNEVLGYKEKVVKKSLRKPAQGGWMGN